MAESKHELFKDYTVLITRMFDARVKSFITNILMGGGRNVPFRYYSYRVEFQARGMYIFRHLNTVTDLVEPFHNFLLSFRFSTYTWCCLDLTIMVG